MMLKPVLAFALAAAALHSPAFAAEENDQIIVHYEDLNLASAEGVSRLDHRISRAVENACTDPGSVREVWRLQNIQNCITAKRNAVAQQRARVIAQAEGRAQLLATAH
ncbi:MAG: UrcA family protein [Sphingomonadaceae bacterium]